MAAIDIVEKYFGVLGRGLAAEMAPKVVKEILIQTLKQKGTNVKKAAEWVEKDVCLWDTLESKQQEGLVKLRRVNSLRWFDSNWVISAIKADVPAVASLFLGWKKGHNWLERQVGIIKDRVGGQA